MLMLGPAQLFHMHVPDNYGNIKNRAWSVAIEYDCTCGFWRFSLAVLPLCHAVSQLIVAPTSFTLLLMRVVKISLQWTLAW